MSEVFTGASGSSDAGTGCPDALCHKLWVGPWHRRQHDPRLPLGREWPTSAALKRHYLV